MSQRESTKGKNREGKNKEARKQRIKEKLVIVLIFLWVFLQTLVSPLSLSFLLLLHVYMRYHRSIGRSPHSLPPRPRALPSASQSLRRPKPGLRCPRCTRDRWTCPRANATSTPDEATTRNRNTFLLGCEYEENNCRALRASTHTWPCCLFHGRGIHRGKNREDTMIMRVTSY